MKQLKSLIVSKLRDFVEKILYRYPQRGTYWVDALDSSAEADPYKWLFVERVTESLVYYSYPYVDYEGMLKKQQDFMTKRSFLGFYRRIDVQ